jgi:hypothetical protein
LLELHRNSVKATSFNAPALGDEDRRWRGAFTSTFLAMSIVLGAPLPSTASEACAAGSPAGEVCLCQLSDIHPTQSAVGMMEVEIGAEKLRSEMRNRSTHDFLEHLKKHNRVEPVVIGPGGLFYITDHHHLARALQEAGATTTYCRISANLSSLNDGAFWQYMVDNNQVYLRDAQGDAIEPSALPSKIADLRDDPFRSLAGAIGQACAFAKQPEGSVATNFLEFSWANYLRANWAETESLLPTSIKTSIARHKLRSSLR